LWLGQRVDQVEHGPDELVQSRKRHLGLGFDGNRTQNADPIGRAYGFVQQRRLADSRFSAQNEGASTTVACSRQKAFDLRDLFLPAEEHDQNVETCDRRYNA